MTSPLMKMSAVAETGFLEKACRRAPDAPAVPTDPVAPNVWLAFVALVVLVAASAGAFLILGLYGFR